MSKYYSYKLIIKILNYAPKPSEVETERAGGEGRFLYIAAQVKVIFDCIFLKIRY